MKYKATYEDKYGRHDTFFLSDGRKLSIVLYGVRFEGRSFDSLSPVEDHDDLQGKLDMNECSELVNYKFTAIIPILLRKEELMLESDLPNFDT